MNFGEALEIVKNGGRAARAGWNGKGMFIHLNPGSAPAPVETDILGLIGGVPHELFETGHAGTVVRMPCLNLRAADGSIVVGWLASQTDLLAEDWVTP